MTNIDYAFQKRVLEDIRACVNNVSSCENEYNDLTKCISALEEKENEDKLKKRRRKRTLVTIARIIVTTMQIALAIVCFIVAFVYLDEKEYIISFLIFASSSFNLFDITYLELNGW